MNEDHPQPEPLRPAASLVVVREPAAGPPKILMVERTAAMAFAPGALVFPGGRVEPADGVSGGDDDRAARMAAIRETIEEAGIAIGIEPPLDSATQKRWRTALSDGAALQALVDETRRRIDLGALQPLAWWSPPQEIARRYDTRFFLAHAPDDLPDAVPDRAETGRAFWATARDTLAAIGCGEARAIFPTRRMLERLARFDRIADLFEDARRRPVATVTPWIERRNGVECLCIPEGLGYPVTAEPLAAALRG